MTSRLPSANRPYLLAAAITALALALRLLLWPILSNDVPYVTFFAGVVTSAWLTGLRGGLLATGLSLLLCYFVFIEPDEVSQAIRISDLVGMGLFAMTGVLSSVVSERLRRATEDAGLEAERLHTTLQSIGDGVIVTDDSGRVRSLNPVAERLTGWSSAEARGHSLPDVFCIVSPETGTARPNPLLQVLGSGGSQSLPQPTVLLARDGAQHPIDDTAAPVLAPDGHVDGSVLVFRDISASQRADQSFRRSQEELSDLFENASVGLHWLDEDGVILRANQAELDMLGYTAEDYLGRRIHEVHVDGEAVDDMLARLRAGEVLRNLPARLRRQDGAIRHVLISASVRWDDGQFVHSRAFSLDVTDRKRVDEMRGLLAAVVESTDDAVISQGLDGRILSWNAGAEAMFGHRASDMVGQMIDLIVPAELRDDEREALARVRDGQRVAPFETSRVSMAGGLLDISLTLSPVRDEAGYIIGASSIARDIRRRKELEQSLRDSDRRKDEFLAVLAHELRNPLAPIRNGVAALRLALKDEPAFGRIGDIIERQVRQMARLLDDLLDVSRITHGKLELRKEVVKLDDVLDLALETSTPLLDAAGQAPSVRLPEQTVVLVADPTRLAQVFSNLISNASKYSQAGAPIRIVARREGADVVVSVADDGIGIAPDALPELFEMFSQAAGARARTQGGIGVGLSLVKGLVNLHAGTVTVTSEGIGRGSTFEVRLPTAQQLRQPEPTSKASEVPPAVGRRVLITDDNKDGADSLAMVVRALGCEVQTTYSGASALQVAEAFHPDVVFMDLGMPEMDGVETARRIRSLPAGKDAVIIALTGWGQERDRQLTTEAGFDAHLVKPIDPAAMRDVLGGVLRHR